MAQSTCPHCKSTSFEISVHTPHGSNYPLTLVQCSDCGAPSGVLPYEDATPRLDDLLKRVKNIEQKLR